MPSLTKAQSEALRVLAIGVAGRPGASRVRASKRKSCLAPRANVNMIAASSLSRLGLARCIDPDLERGYAIDHGFQRGLVCSYLYEITAEGIEVWQAKESDA